MRINEKLNLENLLEDLAMLKTQTGEYNNKLTDGCNLPEENINNPCVA